MRQASPRFHGGACISEFRQPDLQSMTNNDWTQKTALRRRGGVEAVTRQVEAAEFKFNTECRHNNGYTLCESRNFAALQGRH